MCRSVRPQLPEVTWAAFCGTLGALGAPPRADKPYAVLGECPSMRRPVAPSHGYAPRRTKPVPDPPMPTDDAPSRMAGRTAPPPAPPFDVTAVAPTGPTIVLSQLGHDHALVVVRGKICAEFLLSVRQHLTNLVDVGVRYVVVDLAEVTACPPQLVGELAKACRALHAREGGCDRSRQPRAWSPRWSQRLSTNCSPSTVQPGRSFARRADATGAIT
jgi:hypothetical protein